MGETLDPSQCRQAEEAELTFGRGVGVERDGELHWGVVASSIHWEVLVEGEYEIRMVPRAEVGLEHEENATHVEVASWRGKKALVVSACDQTLIGFGGWGVPDEFEWVPVEDLHVLQTEA